MSPKPRRLRPPHLRLVQGGATDPSPPQGALSRDYTNFREGYGQELEVVKHAWIRWQQLLRHLDRPTRYVRASYGWEHLRPVTPSQHLAALAIYGQLYPQSSAAQEALNAWSAVGDQPDVRFINPTEPWEQIELETGSYRIVPTRAGLSVVGASPVRSIELKRPSALADNQFGRLVGRIGFDGTRDSYLQSLWNNRGNLIEATDLLLTIVPDDTPPAYG